MNETTEMNVKNDYLCLSDCEKDACTCGISVECTGYSKPDAPYAIVAGEAFTKDNIEIGTGLIKLVCDEEATFTVAIDGAEDQIVLVGTEIIIDLYNYASVTAVTITSTLDATVVFYVQL